MPTPRELRDLAALPRSASRPRRRSRRRTSALFRDGVDVPPLLVHQLTADPAAPHPGRAAPIRCEARVAEMLFRPQKIAVRDDGAVMAADETDGRALRDDRRLRQPGRAPAAEPDADAHRRSRRRSTRPTPRRTGTATSATTSRSASTAGRPALAALCRVLERWIAHFLGVAVAIRAAARDRRQALGLARRPRRRGERAAERPVQSRRRRRRADGPAPLSVRARLRESRRHARRRSPGGPSISRWRWTPTSRLKLKPQNLLLNLPLARPQ